MTVANANTRNELIALIKSLMAVHRSLLKFQKQIHEGLEERTLSPYEVLHLSINHPDFEWLRVLSTLIVQMDEATEDKDADLDKMHTDAVRELSALFIDEGKNESFKKRVELALSKDPTLQLEFGDLKKRLINYYN